jgi:hypothetical protein
MDVLLYWVMTLYSLWSCVFLYLVNNIETAHKIDIDFKLAYILYLQNPDTGKHLRVIYVHWVLDRSSTGGKALVSTL